MAKHIKETKSQTTEVVPGQNGIVITIFMQIFQDTIETL